MKKLFLLTLIGVNFQAYSMQSEDNFEIGLRKAITEMNEEQKTNIIAGLALHGLIEQCTHPAQHMIKNEKVKTYLQEKSFLDQNGNVHSLIQKYVVHYIATGKLKLMEPQQDIAVEKTR